jgi:hypothetical protein
MTEMIRGEPARPDQPSLGARLTGWKDIATYLNRGVRTAQRWEREFGLPVRRIGTDRSESVFAFTLEIDAWLATASAARAKGLEPVHSEPASHPDDDAGSSSAGLAIAAARETLPLAGPPSVPRRRRRLAWFAVGAVIGLVALVGWWGAAFRTSSTEAPTPVGLSRDPIAVYHLDEGNGTALLDSGRRLAHGSITNGAWAAGRIGKGLDFGPGHQSGRHTVAVFPGMFPFHAPATDASLSFWMWPVDGTHRTLFWTRGDRHSPDADRFHIYSGGVHRSIGPAIGIDYLSPHGVHHLLFEVRVSLGRWTHVALVRAGTGHYTLYLDGQPAATYHDAVPQLPTSATDWALWRMEDNPYPKQNGMLDEIALWNRALSAEEVKAIFTAASPHDSTLPPQNGPGR